MMWPGDPPPLRWLRWGARDSAYLHHVRATRVPLTTAVKIREWCLATVGRGADEAGIEGRWKMWSQNEIHSPGTLTVEIGFRRETDQVVFVLAWSGEVTP